MKVVVLCYEGLDGLSSAAMMARMSHIKKYNFSLKTINYQTAQKEFEELKKERNSVVFVLDFPPTELFDLNELLQEITKNNTIYYWNTHAKTDDSYKQILAKYCKFVDVKFTECSAQMTWQRFMAKDPVAKELASIAYDFEFWQRQDERSTKLSDLLMSKYDKRHLVDLLSKGVFWSEQFEELRSDYLKKKEDKLKLLVKNLIFKDYLGSKFGIGKTSNLLSTSDAGQRILDHSNCDVSVSVYENGKISFRKKPECEIDLSKLAKLFNGGGHTYAASGQIKMEEELPFNVIDTNERWEKALFFVHEKFMEFFTGQKEVELVAE